MANYRFVAGANYQPFTFQEMLTPWTAYKSAYEQAEEKYIDLKNKADTFKYLSESLPEGSRARAIYERYANDLNAYTEDFAKGLSLNNRAGLTEMRNRYQGEIGQLVNADTQLQKELEIRRQTSLKDPSMIYKTDNLTIDDYLGGNRPDLYGVSGNQLYIKGAAIGKAASSRVFNTRVGNKTLGDYYIEYIRDKGYSKEAMDAFRMDASAIPELNKAAEDELIASGVAANLSGEKFRQAKQNLINGIIDGAVTERTVELKENKDKMSLKERVEAAQADARIKLDAIKVDLEREKLNLLREEKEKSSGGADDPVSKFGFATRRIQTNKEIGETKKDLQNWIDFAHYFTKDKNGYWVMTDEGKERYNRAHRNYVNGVNFEAAMHDSFKDFVNNNGLQGMARTDKQVGSKPGGIIDQYINKANGITDQYENKEYVKNIDNTEMNNVKAFLYSVAGRDKSREIIKGEDGKYSLSQGGEDIDLGKLEKDGIGSAQIVVGKYARYIEVTLADKKGTSIKIPLSSFNSNLDSIIKAQFDELDNYDAMIRANGGDPEKDTYMKMNDGTVINIPIEKNKIINGALKNAVSVFGTTKVKEEEIEPSIYLK